MDDVVEIYVKEAVDGQLARSVDDFHRRLREAPDELLSEIAMTVLARPGAVGDTKDSVRGRTLALLVRRGYALDWLVRAYNRKERIIWIDVIENRTEHEAMREAESDLPDGAADWSLEAITPALFKRLLTEQPELKRVVAGLLPRFYQPRSFKELAIGEHFFFASNLTPGQLWQKVSARGYVKSEDHEFRCRVGSIYVEVDPPVHQSVIERYLAEHKSSTPELVYSRDGQECGRLTGKQRRCQMDGCTGHRLGVRWPDQHITWPCTKGMTIRGDGQWQIG